MPLLGADGGGRRLWPRGTPATRRLSSPLTSHDTDVTFSLHPYTEPPVISLEKVGGSIPSVIFQTKCTSVWRCILLGADDEIRVFNPLAITGVQPVEKNQPIHFIESLIHFRLSWNCDVIFPQVSPVY